MVRKALLLGVLALSGAATVGLGSCAALTPEDEARVARIVARSVALWQVSQERALITAEWAEVVSLLAEVHELAVRVAGSDPDLASLLRTTVLTLQAIQEPGVARAELHGPPVPRALREQWWPAAVLQSSKEPR